MSAPAPLSHDETCEAIRLCRVVVEADDSEPIGSALGRLRFLLDRFPGTPTSTEGAAA